MKKLYSYKDFNIYKLDSTFVENYSQEICDSLDQIQLVDKHTKEQLLSTEKGNRKLLFKFDHSLIALAKDEYAGVIIGYEREAEGNELYPKNSIYLSDIAISNKFQKQGLGKFLVKAWLEYNQRVGFLALKGKMSFSVQTNAAKWNQHVQDLYTSLGFKKIAKKTYENRIDGVYFLS